MEPTKRQEKQSSLLFLLLYYNLGGELIYILKQRLVAQKIAKEKANQVLVDVMTNFVNCRNYWMRTHVTSTNRVLDSMALKAPFESVISSSPIMKLTPASYDKLFDLMIGIFKYQLCQAPMPSSLFYITLNHLNSIVEIAAAIGPGIKNVVKGMRDNFQSQFTSLTKYQWFILRNIILSEFLIDIKTRVSILIREKKQDMDTGLFFIPIPSVQGNVLITHFDDGARVIREDGIFQDQGVIETTTLGLDIYSTDSDEKNDSTDQERKDALNACTGKEASLLASMLLQDQKPQAVAALALDFDFDQDFDHKQTDIRSGATETNNESTELKVSHTVVRADRFELEDGEYDPVDDDDLLALMDS